MHPFISIIIPLYNKERHIQETIKSVLEQSFCDFELIIVNDGSTDGSVNIVKEIRDNRIKLIQQPNGGPSKARNTGVKNASGEWIVFLDADDVFLPNALFTFADLVKDYPQEKCFACNYYTKYGDIYSKYYFVPGTYTIKNPMRAWCLHSLMPRTGASMFHREIALQYLHDEHLRRYEDAEWLFRVMRKHSFVRSSQPVMVYNCDSVEASRRREHIEDDFLGNMDFHKKGIWEQLALYQLLQQAYHLYPLKSTERYYSYIHGKMQIKLQLLSLLCAPYIYCSKCYSKIHKKLVGKNYNPR